MTAWASTGLEGLDKILCDLKKGDNVVWRVDSVEDYIAARGNISPGLVVSNFVLQKINPIVAKKPAAQSDGLIARIVQLDPVRHSRF